MSTQQAETPVAFKATALTTLSQGLQAISQSASSPTDFYHKSFIAIASNFEVVWGLLEIQVAGRTVTREYSQEQLDTEVLAEFAYSLSVEAQMDAVARARLVPGTDDQFAIISCPVKECNSDSVIGSMTYFLSVEDREGAKSKMKGIEKSIALVDRLAEQGATAAVQAPKVEPTPELRALVNSAKYENIHALCFALVNSYCQKFGCQKTAIGLVENSQVRLYAISGLDSIVENSPAVIDIKQAQEECLDLNHRVLVQEELSEADAPSDGFLIHKKWHTQTSAAAVASIPIKVEDETIAVFSLERNLNSPFSSQELKQVEDTIQAFGPAINLMKRSSRSLRNHFGETVRNRLVKPLKTGFIGIASIAAVAFVILGWLPYRPTVPCTIQPQNVNHLVAPFDAVLAEASLFAGDEIAAGQPILKFETRDLELQRDAILAEVKSKEIARNQAIIKRDKAAASIIDAEVNAKRVELKMVQRKIDQATMTSHFDGDIIRGDMRRSIGQIIPKGTPMMEIAPKDGMRIQLEIPESKATLVKVGHEGYFAASTRPGDSHKFVITKITPSTSVADGKNVLLAEAQVEGNSDWMKTGMTGYANVRAGWKPVWWMLGHSIYDGMRLRFWL